MKKVKKLTAVILCITMLTPFFSVNVKAAEGTLGEVVDGSTLTNDSESSGIWKPIARGTYLSSGTCAIVDIGNRLIQISASTYCNRVCASVDAALFLERLSGGSWGPVEQFTRTAYNTASATVSTTYPVVKGYKYRVRGGHVAYQNGVTETGVSYSDSILIS